MFQLISNTFATTHSRLLHLFFLFFNHESLQLLDLAASTSLAARRSAASYRGPNSSMEHTALLNDGRWQHTTYPFPPFSSIPFPFSPLSSLFPVYSLLITFLHPSVSSFLYFTHISLNFSLSLHLVEPVGIMLPIESTEDRGSNSWGYYRTGGNWRDQNDVRTQSDTFVRAWGVKRLHAWNELLH